MAEELVSLGTDPVDFQFENEEIRTALENDRDLDLEEIDRMEQTGGKANEKKKRSFDRADLLQDGLDDELRLIALKALETRSFV